MNESLMDTFKRFYADYRTAANVEQSFTDAYQAVAFYVIEQTSQLAQESKLDDIKQLTREFKEIRFAISPSNDALKERFEQELVEKMLDRVPT
ncbi:hypothetical protein [Paenibacillus sp. N3.4]|uniref:hypothetical protein n=1 Tax=Paenibacillus sp. N3.4 TaxID=2603222 RepID=UPI0011CA4931|nr:hypothetical protein [Paenibacillus sp. N3.4]TXK72108.1 hypothetical protein FU659_31830 [Paenibacillus sp. N3.4]